MVWPGPRSLRHADRARDIDAARSAEAQAFVLEQLENQRQRFLVRYLVGVIDRRVFEIGRHAALTDAFGDRVALHLQLAGLDPGIDRSTHRIGGGDLDVRVARLQRKSDARERSAGADRAREAIDQPLGLLPDLSARGFLVRLTVRDVVELIGPDRRLGIVLGELFGDAFGDLHVVVRIAIGDGGHFDELRAEKPERVLLLLALRVGNDDDRFQSERIAHDGDADAGVARGALDDGAAGAQQSAVERDLDDVEGGPVLDRLAGVHELGLAEDFAPRAFGGSLQADQRRIADRCKDIRLDD